MTYVFIFFEHLIEGGGVAMSDSHLIISKIMATVFMVVHFLTYNFHFFLTTGFKRTSVKDLVATN